MKHAASKWIEAMRPRTLPVGAAGVIVGTACALLCGDFSPIPAILCLLFAQLAQIAANFGNEYYDFVNGLDRRGREGFRRGVTEGDISPSAMRNATFATLAAAAITGCALLLYGHWYLIPAGIAIGLFAIAYSAGPYPLSHHGLGDLAAAIFFGIVPVTFTCYLQQGGWHGLPLSLPASVATGLLAANVMIVNNYRDMEDDASVGKRTTAVIFGRTVMSRAYLLSGIVAMAVMTPVWTSLPAWSLLIPTTYLAAHIAVWRQLTRNLGAALNPLLGRTAAILLIFSLLLLIAAILRTSI